MKLFDVIVKTPHSDEGERFFQVFAESLEEAYEKAGQLICALDEYIDFIVEV